MKIDLDKIIKQSKTNIENIALKEFSESAYLNYSMYVILDRALPHISDGLKPVQRRIIYSMHQLGLDNASKYKKSARTIGDVLGKFHPHGDSACYEAMVMMAQDFNYNFPLVDGQGNWGTQDDPKSFAAMRYTESRLTSFSDLFLNEIDKGTVQWNPNFDGSLLEPRQLPSKIPNIMINGSSGIAVGMSTDIPSHNITEILNATMMLLDKPKTTNEELMNIVKGPDFPTAGEIIAHDSEIDSIYKNGSGNIKLRATYSDNKKEIIINSIPYQTHVTRIIDQIHDEVNAKKLPFIQSILDDSDQDNPVRIIIKYRGRSHTSEEIMSHLFLNTDLEKNIRVNLNMIGLDGKPEIKNLRQILAEWIKFRTTVVKNKLTWEITKIKDRIHILEGFIIVYKYLDKIITIIRNEDNPKKKILKLYKFSERQYEAIINMRLRNLAKLHERNIVNELKELKDDEKRISKILGSNIQLKKYMKNELVEIINLYDKSRETSINNEYVKKSTEIKVIQPSIDITAVLSQNGWVKFIKGHIDDLDETKFKTGDSYLTHVHTNTESDLAFFDDLGNIYNLDKSKILPTRGNGEPLTNFFILNDGVSIVGIHNLDSKKSILNVSTQGIGFIANHEDMIVKNRKGKVLLKIKNSKALRPCSLDHDKDKYYLLITSDNYMLIGNLKTVPILSRGRGVKLINLPKKSDEFIKFSGIFNKNQTLYFNYSNGKSKKMSTEDLSSYFMDKNRRGKKLDKKFILEKYKTTYNIE